MITARKLIRSEIPNITPQDEAENALNLMDQFGIVHIVVTDQNQYVGLLTEAELLSVRGTIADDMGSLEMDKPFVSPEMHILDVLKIAGENHISVIPVVDENGGYLGSITLEDLVNEMSLMKGMAFQGGIVVLEMEEKDYSLQQIARIVEENDAKVLSLTISDGEDGKIELNLKISKPDLNAILQSFERFQYHIKASYQEPGYTEDLHKRYEELMRYLNM